MTAPTCTATLNKTTFQPGEQMVLTVNYADVDTKPISVQVIVTDSTGASSTPVTVNAVIDPSSIAVTSNPVRTWVAGPNNGSVATFTATA